MGLVSVLSTIHCKKGKALGIVVTSRAICVFLGIVMGKCVRESRV